VPRRPLIVAATGLAVVAPLAVTDALSTGAVEAARTPAAAAEQPDWYEIARRKGQPVAVLTRRTALRATPGGRKVAKLKRRTEWGTPTVLAALGRRGNWLRVLATELPNGRSGWIPSSAAGVVASQWSVTVDLSRRALAVRRAGKTVRRFTVAVGKPSTPTPTGRFAVTDKLTFRGGSAAYGCCAVALTGRQTHIERGWSGGNRLAIHGTRLTGTIGTAASFGCLRASDADVRWLVRRLYLGSVVLIRP
jgi:lipoprotein-anchoring transpeptidase ErfK/SrfK